MKAQNQLTKILGLSIIALTATAFQSIQPLGFNELFHKDLADYVATQFNPAEAEFMGDQEELFESLLIEIEKHPELLDQLPVEIRTEIKDWKSLGKDLI